MLLRSTAIAVALFGSGVGLAGPANAQGAPVAAAPVAAEAVEYLDIMVESVGVEVRTRGAGQNALEIDATPIFEALKSRSESQGSIIAYWRHQDGAVLSLDMSDGKVRANGVVLGALPGWEPRDTADTWLSLNAISVLTGTVVEGDVATGLQFNLDERLRPQFDLDLVVNGERLNVIGEEPRTLGSVLLVPLAPVVEALGHELSVDEIAGIVTVRRVQDSAELSLELGTGLVTVNGVPRGVSPNMAYADPDNLVLPFSAVETLTGTHIELAPGSSRVEITLDDRLFGAALPGERIVDEAEQTGFTPERLDFQIGEDGPQRYELSSRFQNYNMRSRYETVGGFGDAAALQPGWVSTDIQALDGWVATVGDYTPTFREFTGVDSGRVRGVSYRDRLDDGTLLAIAAGVPVAGAEQVSDRASKPLFGGFVGGVRVIRPDDNVEYGISAKVSEDGERGRLVMSGQSGISRNLAEGETGLRSASASYNLGAFQTPGETGLDISGQLEARYTLSDQIGVRASAAYDGAKFNAGDESVPTVEKNAEPSETADTAATDRFAGVFGQVVGARTTGALSADWRAVDDWGMFRNVGAGARATIAYDDGNHGSVRSSLSTSAQALVGEAGISLAMNAGLTSADNDGTASTLSIRATKRFDWGRAQIAYSRNATDSLMDQRLIASVAASPIKRHLGKGASVSVGPNATALVTPTDTSLRFGATGAVQSGQVFGDRFRVSGQMSALSSVDPTNSATRLFASANATYDVTRSVQLQMGYADDFDGRQDFTFGLRGSVEFNEPRKHTRPLDGRGVLTGGVFLDKNRDGVRQDDEPGVSRVRISVRGTRLALNVDGRGQFTIQNMKEGLYDLSLDSRSLPLGYLVPEDSEPKVTIGEGRITRIDIPVIASGQIRGAVFIDANGNGEADSGERRLEGHWVSLKADGDGEKMSTQAATFGQYGFENLAPGSYVMTVNVGGRRTNIGITLSEDDLFHVVAVAIPPENSSDDGPQIETVTVIAADVEAPATQVVAEP